MNIEQALRWADNNTVDESVQRLRSRAAAKAMACEVRNLRTLLSEALDALYCGEEGDIFERSHRCGRCDDYVDRNGVIRMKIEEALLGVDQNE